MNTPMMLFDDDYDDDDDDAGQERDKVNLAGFHFNLAAAEAATAERQNRRSAETSFVMSGLCCHNWDGDVVHDVIERVCMFVSIWLFSTVAGMISPDSKADKKVDESARSDRTSVLASFIPITAKK